MGDRFENQAADAYTRIVKDYPLSDRVDEAGKKLQAMNRPVPQADPVAYSRMKYEMENREKAGMMGHVWGMFKHSPDTRAAAKSGSPAMVMNRPTIPVSVPANAAGTGTVSGSSDVSVQTVTDTTALDTKPDARQNPPAPADGSAANGTSTANGTGAVKPAEAPAATGNPTLPMNHQGKPKKSKKKKSEPKSETKSDTTDQTKQ